MTLEEAIREYKAAVRRVGQGKPFTCSQEAQDIYTAHYNRTVHGYGTLTEEQRNILEEAEAPSKP